MTGAGIRALLAAAGIVLAGLGASDALACGTGGYTYAGVAASRHAYGISASITPLPFFSVVSGHVAGWVGVGGPGQGANGADEWLQVGFSGFPGANDNSLYYELALPGRRPTYHELVNSVATGKTQRVAVLEIAGRPDSWRVWLNGSPVSKAIHLPTSHGRWAPIATAESWDGGTGGSCNGFLYRFNSVSVAGAPGGSWQPLVGGTTITSATTRLARGRSASFLAAEGPVALRTLQTFSW